MPKVKGREAVRSYIAQAPEQLAQKVLPGAGRAAANVIADEARRLSISDEVTSAIKVTAKRDGLTVVAKVQVKGKGSYLAPWLEYGTAPHFISVDPAASGGRSAARINLLDKEAAKQGQAGPGASLVINGKFVGATVWHPGARAHPFLRPALDTKAGEAIAAAQTYIDTRVARMRKGGLAEPESATQ